MQNLRVQGWGGGGEVLHVRGLSENLFILCSSDRVYGSTTLEEVANYGQSENDFPLRGTPGSSWWGCAVPFSKMSFFTPVFRPGL